MTEAPATSTGPAERAGQVIVVTIAVLAAALLIGALVYAIGTGRRDQSALAAAGCEPGLSSDTRACTTQPMLAAEYTAILTPAAQQLNVDESAYAASAGHDLIAAEIALTAEAATERAFDANLGGITFPPAIAPVADALIRAGQARADELTTQARSSSLNQLLSYDNQVQAATAAVQTQLNRLRAAIDAPVR
jgi:hypothetical protein